MRRKRRRAAGDRGERRGIGAWLTTAVDPSVLRWVVGLSFIGMAIWTLIPDEIEEDETRAAGRFGATTARSRGHTHCPV